MCLIFRETVEYCTVEFESEVTLSQGRDDITQGGFRQVVALSVLNLYAEKGGYQLGVLVLVVIFPPIFGHCEKLTRGLREKRVEILTEMRYLVVLERSRNTHMFDIGVYRHRILLDVFAMGEETLWCCRYSHNLGGPIKSGSICLGI